jgi:SSS family solute:Na+ symporter
VYKEYVRPDCSGREEATVAKVVSLVVKFGALAFIVLAPQKYAIQLQLLGGVWTLQTLPAIVVGLYTRAIHRWGLLAGWAAGMITGTWMAYSLEFKGTVYPLHLGPLTIPAYAAVWALLVNLAVAAVASFALRAAGAPPGDDATRPEDYGPA